jgi:hypothetical protein
MSARAYHREWARARSARVALACVLLLGGCSGDNDKTSARPERLGAQRFAALTTALTNATPQGRLSVPEAVSGANRQAAIARRYGAQTTAGGCQHALLTLAAAYEAFAHAAAASTTGPTAEDAYGKAAGTVSRTLTAAQAACT